MKTPDLGRLGIPGVAGIGLLLFCMSLYFGSLAPAREQLATLKNEETQLLQSISVQSDAQPQDRPVPDEPLLPLTDAPELLKKISAAAEKYGITIARASYRQTDQDKQHRIEVSLPLRGSYPSLREYLRDVLALAPMSSLDELSLQRAQSSDPLVDANVRLSYSFAERP